MRSRGWTYSTSLNRSVSMMRFFLTARVSVIRARQSSALVRTVCFILVVETGHQRGVKSLGCRVDEATLNTRDRACPTNNPHLATNMNWSNGLQHEEVRTTFLSRSGGEKGQLVGFQYGPDGGYIHGQGCHHLALSGHRVVHGSWMARAMNNPREVHFMCRLTVTDKQSPPIITNVIRIPSSAGWNDGQNWGGPRETLELSRLANGSTSNGQQHNTQQGLFSLFTTQLVLESVRPTSVMPDTLGHDCRAAMSSTHVSPRSQLQGGGRGLTWQRLGQIADCRRGAGGSGR